MRMRWYMLIFKKKYYLIMYFNKHLVCVHVSVSK